MGFKLIPLKVLTLGTVFREGERTKGGEEALSFNSHFCKNDKRGRHAMMHYRFLFIIY